MANLKGGTTIGGQLALNTSNGLALTGGRKGNTFIPGVYFTRYGPIDWGATLQIGGNGTLGISEQILLHLWLPLMVIYILMLVVLRQPT
jgi:hypothetical protein